MFNTDSVISLFKLFTGLEELENQTFIILAMQQTQEILKPDIDETDIRPNFLCAAIANYRYQQAKAAADNSAYTYAGKMLQEGRTQPLAFAESMLKDYYQLCRDIIKPQNFVFMGFSKGDELND